LPLLSMQGIGPSPSFSSAVPANKGTSGTGVLRLDIWRYDDSTYGITHVLALLADPDHPDPEPVVQLTALATLRL
jgi:hypothetical protein